MDEASEWAASQVLLAKDGVAAVLNISPWSAHQLMRSGALPTVRLSERRLRVRASDLEAFIADRLVPAQPA